MARWRERYHDARIRETKFLMSFNMIRLDKRLIVLLGVFVSLNFFDALSTLIAIHSGPTFVELNPIASQLFRLSFDGFVVALGLKYAPIAPLIYATYLKDKGTRPVVFRIVKVSAFVALAAADIFYVAVVGSNIVTLAHFYLAIG
ncbi:MAG: DUF5658 family protein [Thaumarchaeota archaeon]|nr:DUF5658 family protein [Nitrososphaerota archaeon]